MSVMRVEFTSPESGAYIHEMADVIEISFADKDGEKYLLKLHTGDSETVEQMHNLYIDLTYPDGKTMGLESIWIAEEVNNNGNS